MTLYVPAMILLFFPGGTTADLQVTNTPAGLISIIVHDMILRSVRMGGGNQQSLARMSLLPGFNSGICC